MKKVECASVVIGIQVDAFVEEHPQGRSRLPIPRRHARRPEIGTAAQALRGGPVAEARGSGRAARRRRSSGKVEGERTLGRVGERPCYPHRRLRIVFPNGYLLRGGGCRTPRSGRARHRFLLRLMLILNERARSL